MHSDEIYASLPFQIDIEKMFNESVKLAKEHCPYEESRKELKKYSKIFSGHGDYILTNVHELSK